MSSPVAKTTELEARAATWGAAPVVRRNGARAASRSALRARVEARALRVVNAVVAALLLVVTSPLMLLIAVVIKLTSRGPVLYTQTRVGLDRRNGGRQNENWRRRVDYGGRLFRIYKFRTMHVGSDNGGQVWARPNDPRVTAIGRVLRLYRLDELPQLFNVLKGDMSVVGPRPEQPEIALQLREKIDGYTSRHRVPPGITGWAQVNLQYDSSVEDVRRKLELDLEYIENRSVREDLTILLKTVPVVIFKRGAC